MSAERSFDLRSNPWILTLTRGGVREVDLLGLFQRADDVELDWSSPLEAVAVLRQVLLPVYWRACGLPRDEAEWSQRFDEGPAVEVVSSYLDRQDGRFDLFDQYRAFAQAAGLRSAKGEWGPSSLLVPNVATGNNVPLFSPKTEADPPALTFSAAARALLATQCWDTAAIKTGAVGDPKANAGKTTGNPPGPVGQLGLIVPVGRNFAETLILNTPISPQGMDPDDLPQWERPPQTPEWESRPAIGLLDHYTWQARRIRLDPDRTAVRRALVAAGDRLTPLDRRLEHHTAWQPVRDPKGGQAPWGPLRHQPGKGAWRGLDALLAVDSTSSLLQQCRQLSRYHLDPDYPLQAVTVGVVYGNQRAVFEEVVHDRLPLPVLALLPDGDARDIVLEMAAASESLRTAANHPDENLRRAQGAQPVPWDKGMRLGDQLIAELDPLVRRFLSGAQTHPDQVEQGLVAWKLAARARALDIIRPVLDATPDTAVIGRHKDRWHRLADAEAYYLSAVNKAVPDQRNGDRQ